MPGPSLAPAPAARSSSEDGDSSRRELTDALASWFTHPRVRGLQAVHLRHGPTEMLWKVSIDTLAPYRRRGFAGDCARFLIQHMTIHGKEPVWGSFESNEASLRLAQVLGFLPVGHLVVFFRKGEEPR